MLLFEILYPVPAEILENQVSQPMQIGIIRPAVVRLSELLNKLFQVGIRGYHKGGDGDAQLAAPGGNTQGFFHDLAIKAKAVFIIFCSFRLDHFPLRV